MSHLSRPIVLSNKATLTLRVLTVAVTAALLSSCGSAATPAATTAPTAAPAATEAVAATAEPSASPTEAVAASTEVTATAETTATQETVTLKWGLWGDTEELKGHQAVADAFTAKYPNIKIDIQAAPWDDYNTKLKTLIASGDPNLYDVFFYGYNVENLVQQGVIEDLTPWAKKTGYDFNDYWPGILDRATVNGEVYGLVRDADASLLYYNKDIFDEAKVAYPTDKWTLDDLKAAAEKLTKVESNGRVSRYGLGFEAGKVDSFLVGNGGGYLDSNTNPTKSILDTPESLAILNYFTDLIAKNYAIKPSALEQAGGDAAAFQQGKVAIIIQNASRIPAFNAAKLNYDISALPLPPSGKRANNAAGAAWHISAKSQHKEAAWTFLSWLQSADGGLGIYAKQGGLFPALKSVATSAAFTDPSQTPANRAAFTIEGAGLTLLQPITLPEWDDLSGTLISPSLEKIWTLESTPDKVVPDLVTKINDYLKQKGYPKQ